MLSLNSGKNGVGNAVVNVGALTPHPRNYNQHSPAQVGDLRRSLRRFGQVRSIVVQAQAEPGRWLIVAGHGIVAAARAEGLDTLRADIIPAGWDDAMVLAYLAADNELARQGQPDEAQLAALLRDVQAQADRELAALAAGSEARLTEMLATLDGGAAGDAEPQIDRAAELQEKWQVRPGDLWRIGEHRLACGDCTDRAVVERVMGGEKLGGLVADPPYSSGGFTRGDRQAATGNKYQYNQDGVDVRYLDFAGDNKDQRSWITWCHLWLSLWLQHAKVGAPFALFIDWRQLPALTDAVQSAGWLWRGVAVWDKTEAARPMYGRFKPQCEYVVWGSAGPLPINDGSPAYPGVIRQPVELVEKVHLTQKPLKVGEWSLSMTHSGEVVADPFLGSGTTLVACQNLHRRGRGIEISPEYCAVVLERMATAFPGIEIERVTPRAKMDLVSDA